MDNPFESGHIKNYILLYASVVVIMVLFFIASTLFNDVENFKQKIFDTEVKEDVMPKEEKDEEATKTKFKLLEVNSESYSGYNSGVEVQGLEESH